MSFTGMSFESVGSSFYPSGDDAALTCVVEELDHGEISSFSYTWPGACVQCKEETSSLYSLAVHTSILTY